jgi:hypothetical protein
MNTTTSQKTDDLIRLELEVLEGRATPASLRRLARLRRKHENAALGRLVKVLDTWEFRDGVLHTARLRDSTKQLADCLGDRQWATVQVLELGWNKLKVLGGTSDLLSSMPLLHTLTLGRAPMPVLPCPHITKLTVPDASIALIAERFPGLRVLELEYTSEPAALWQHPFLYGLDSISVGQLTWTKDVVRLKTRHYSDDTRCLEHGPALRRFEVQEEELLGEGGWELQELFQAARRKGAEVVLLPEAEPREARRNWRYERWH